MNLLGRSPSSDLLNSSDRHSKPTEPLTQSHGIENLFTRKCSASKAVAKILSLPRNSHRNVSSSHLSVVLGEPTTGKQSQTVSFADGIRQDTSRMSNLSEGSGTSTLDVKIRGCHEELVDIKRLMTESEGLGYSSGPLDSGMFKFSYED